MSRRLRDLARDVASRREVCKPGEGRRLASALVQVFECLDTMNRVHHDGNDPAATAILAAMERKLVRKRS